MNWFRRLRNHMRRSRSLREFNSRLVRFKAMQRLYEAELISAGRFDRERYQFQQFILGEEED